MSLWLIAGIAAGGLWLLYAVREAGKADEKSRQQERAISDVQKAAEVRRSVDSEPDPVQRLRDEWER